MRKEAQNKNSFFLLHSDKGNLKQFANTKTKSHFLFDQIATTQVQ